MTVNVPAKPVSKAYVKPAAVKLTSGDNATKSAASADATHSKAGKASSSTAAAAPKAPRAKNAYMFFLADKRTAVKGGQPLPDNTMQHTPANLLALSMLTITVIACTQPAAAFHAMANDLHCMALQHTSTSAAFHLAWSESVDVL